jgi:hypothetical protein
MKADFLWALLQQRHGLHWESERAWQHHVRHDLLTYQDIEDQNSTVMCVLCHLPSNDQVFVNNHLRLAIFSRLEM